MKCPNCIEPCNGPHLVKKGDYYQSADGYFLKSDKWNFLPLEKEFNQEQLLEIIETLDYLNNHF